MIYIVKHKQYDNPVPEGYKELFVGDLYKGKGDDIERLNPFINEVTAMYQMWKNTDDDILGLVHYRRFFVAGEEILSYEKAKEILKDYDMIIAPEYVTYPTVFKQLRTEIAYEDRELLTKYFVKLSQADKYVRFGFDRRSFNPRNMFIAHREVAEEYFEWLFPILIPITEEYVKECGNHNKRLIGYLTERMFCGWILKRNPKCYRMEYTEV